VCVCVCVCVCVWPVKHLNGVPLKTRIVHGIYSSRKTFLRMRTPENTQKTELLNRSVAFFVNFGIQAMISGFSVVYLMTSRQKLEKGS